MRSWSEETTYSYSFPYSYSNLKSRNMHGGCEVPFSFYIDDTVKRCSKMARGHGPDQVWTGPKLAENVYYVHYRLDFRRSLESGLCSSSAGVERGLISRIAAGNRTYVAVMDYAKISNYMLG